MKGDPRVMVYQTFKATRTEGARTLFQKQRINIGSDISIHFQEGVTWGVCCSVIYKYIENVANTNMAVINPKGKSLLRTEYAHLFQILRP